jgi:hypothetical protein
MLTASQLGGEGRKLKARGRKCGREIDIETSERTVFDVS